MPAAAGNGHGVEQLEEVEVQRLQQPFCGALASLQLGPLGIGRLGVAKDVIDAAV